MAVSTIGGNVLAAGLLQATLNPDPCALSTTNEQTFPIPGLRVGDVVMVNTPAVAAFDAGLGVVGARVSAANTLAIRFGNFTAGIINPGPGVWTIFVLRPENIMPTSFSP